MQLFLFSQGPCLPVVDNLRPAEEVKPRFGADVPQESEMPSSFPECEACHAWGEMGMVDGQFHNVRPSTHNDTNKYKSGRFLKH